MEPKADNNDAKEKKKKSKLDNLIHYLQYTQASEFTGYIKINFSQGSIGRIEKFEEILK